MSNSTIIATEPSSTAPTSTSPSTTAAANHSKITKPARSSNKVAKCFKAPYRVLRRARDFYVSCFTGCARRSSYGPMMGYPARVVSAVPRGYSFHSQSTSSEDDIRDLIRAASRGSIGMSPGFSPAASTKESVVPRSQSVPIGRIDEDQPCEFGNDINLMGLPPMCPRSQSCEVVSRRKVGFVA